MSLFDTIQSDIKVAMKQGEAETRDALRLLLSYIKTAAIDSGQHDATQLSDEDVMGMIRKEIKKRNDSIEAFEKAGRNDLVDKEKQEKAIFEKYVPAQLDATAIDVVVQQVLDELGANANFGAVMQKSMEQLAGKADGSLVSQRVKALLG